MNKVFQIGHLTRDPEVKNLSGGSAVVNCCVATTRSVPKGDSFVEESTFVDFTIWGKRGEAFARYHRKGSRVALEGRLTLDRWDDKTTGQKMSKLRMTVEEWEFVSDKQQHPDPHEEAGVIGEDVPF